MCGCMVNGVAHGPQRETTLCQLHMRKFKDGDELFLEPWRAKAFPVIKDLMVDRSAFDRIIAAGGFVSVATGSAPDGNAILIPRDNAERAMDAAACIGCGACVAMCPNASASLFVSAKIAHLALLPQGQPERERASSPWSPRPTRKFSEAAPISASAKLSAPRASSSKTSPS
jgi:succinate dehydrogenase / fumarate reductase iron-sulfur subunit